MDRENIVLRALLKLMNFGRTQFTLAELLAEARKTDGKASIDFDDVERILSELQTSRLIAAAQGKTDTYRFVADISALRGRILEDPVSGELSLPEESSEVSFEELLGSVWTLVDEPEEPQDDVPDFFRRRRMDVIRRRFSALAEEDLKASEEEEDEDDEDDDDLFGSDSLKPTRAQEDAVKRAIDSLFEPPRHRGDGEDDFSSALSGAEERGNKLEEEESKETGMDDDSLGAYLDAILSDTPEKDESVDDMLKRKAALALDRGDAEEAMKYLKAAETMGSMKPLPEEAADALGIASVQMQLENEEVPPEYIRALGFGVKEGFTSNSRIQKLLGIGVAKAGRIIDWMDGMSYLGKYDRRKGRYPILIDRENFEDRYGPLPEE